MRRRKKHIVIKHKTVLSKSSKKYIYLFILILLLSLIIVALSIYLYQLGYNKGKEAAQCSARSFYKRSLEQIKLQEREALKKILQPSTLSEIEDYNQNLSSSQNAHSSSSQSFASSKSSLFSSQSSHSVPVQKKRDKRGLPKPRLVIIIDDVAYGSQVRAIKALGLPINVSFFPPTPTHPNTPRYAKGLTHYMIHLPMEAMHYSHEERYTFRPSTSTLAMDRYIASLRKEFPKARCINNHTGSRFTADYKAMKRLISVLDRYHFCFIDSRTTPRTQVPRLMRNLHRRYLARNIFLDNDINVAKIKAQLKKAIRLAKRRGLAIAIGHPHAKTLEAIRESKGILKEVRLIYVDELLH